MFLVVSFVAISSFYLAVLRTSIMGGGVMYHAPCSSKAVSCLSGYASALLVPKGAGGPKAETPIYVLSFDYLIFRLYFPFYVDFPYTSRSGGANGTRACICVFLVGT